MDLKDYGLVSEQLLKCAYEVEKAKRPAYTFNKTDVLTNFKSVAERLNLTPLQVWSVYFLKHIDAITSYAQNVRTPQAESIDSRFYDAINYLKLGFALLKEKEGEKK